MSNLRQFGIAGSAYSADFGGQLLGGLNSTTSFFRYPEDNKPFVWSRQLLQGGYVAQRTTNNWYKITADLDCPSTIVDITRLTTDTNDSTSASYGTVSGCSFRSNSPTAGGKDNSDGTGSRLAKENDLLYTSATPHILEMQASRGIYTIRYAKGETKNGGHPNNIEYDRHMGLSVSNVLFTDGHVTTIRKEFWGWNLYETSASVFFPKEPAFNAWTKLFAVDVPKIQWN